MQVPSFLAPKTFAVEFDGRTLVFQAVSVEVMARVLEHAAELRDAAAAAFGPEADLGRLLRAIADRRELAGRLVLDALRGEAWVARPVTDEAAREFVASVDDLTLMTLLGGVAGANARAFRPFFASLRAMAEAMRDAAPAAQAEPRSAPAG
jgi:hypothetical protein